MKVAISSNGPNLDAEIDPRFGRCQFFLLVNLDDMSFDSVPNGINTLEGGAGIQAAKSVVEHGAQAVLTGYIGPNAERVLVAAGLNTITGVSGTVREAAEQYKQSQLRPAQQRKEHENFRTETVKRGSQSKGQTQAPLAGFGTGRGMGGGRGMRCGRGRGEGRGIGRGSKISSTKASSNQTIEGQKFADQKTSK
jgi:predicted Fe-Mo cluster-binding NifX family protein